MSEDNNVDAEELLKLGIKLHITHHGFDGLYNKDVDYRGNTCCCFGDNIGKNCKGDLLNAIDYCCFGYYGKPTTIVEQKRRK